MAAPRYFIISVTDPDTKVPMPVEMEYHYTTRGLEQMRRNMLLAEEFKRGIILGPTGTSMDNERDWFKEMVEVWRKRRDDEEKKQVN